MKRMYVHPKADENWDKIYLHVKPSARINKPVIVFSEQKELEDLLKRAIKVGAMATDSILEKDPDWVLIAVRIFLKDL